MCAPIIQQIVFDKTSYLPGDLITATVNYTACCSGPFSTAAQDSGGRTWTLLSDDGISTAILTATA